MLGSTSRTCAERFGEAAAFVDGHGRTLSYRHLDERSDAIAAALASRWAICEGDVVGVSLPSNFDYVITYVALAKIGAITAGLNPTLSTTEREAMISRLDASLVVDPAVHAELAERHGGSPLTRPGPLRPRPDREVAIVFTSGTTGTPKGAVFTERQLDAIKLIDLGPDRVDTWGGGAPMIASTQFAHVGFMTKLPWYLQTATRIHILDRWRADDVLRIIASERIPTIGAVAPQLALLLRSPLMDQLDLGCVERIIAGGAASPPALVAEATERFGASYSIRYSSTESGGVGLATAFDAPPDEALHTIGHPRPGVEVKIVDTDDTPVDPGEVGELCLRSPAVFDRYWNDPDATMATLRDGWLHTGDLARVTESGAVAMCGRRGDMFIRGGYNVHPSEVEAVLSRHPSVAGVAVAPRADPVMGEIGVALVVPRDPSHPPSLDDLRDFGASGLARWKLPEALRLLDDLPLTPMAKVDRTALRALAADDGTTE